MNQNNNTFIPNGQVPSQPVVGSTPVPPQVAAQGQVAVTQQVQTTTPQQGDSAAIVDYSSSSKDPNVIICSKCGSEIKKESRYCMKCGQLNYSHPDNESMKQYAWQSIKQGHFISGANSSDNAPLSMDGGRMATKSDPTGLCLIVNIFLHLLLAVISYSITNKIIMSTGTVDSTANLILPIFGYFLILFLANFTIQKIFIKAEEPWWGYFIPFYNIYIMFKISMGSGWLFLLLLIPVVGAVVSCISTYKLGKKFYKNGWLTLFFPFIMLPIIAFDKKAEYSMLAKKEVSISEISASGKTKSEKAYGIKKFIVTCILIVVASVVLYFLWPYLKPLVQKGYDIIMEYINKLGEMNS